MIKYLDLSQENKEYTEIYKIKLEEFFKRGQFILGEETELFEQEFANFCQTKFCVGVGNGLDALKLSLKAWGIGFGDEVIVPSNTYIATWLAVTQVGAKPVPVEPNMKSYNIDETNIETKITEKTKAIIVVHLYGRAVDAKKISLMAKKHGIKVLEDCAQAHGAIFNGCRVGSMGDAGAFSFYPGIYLGAMGDGGAITTNDPNLYKELKMLRNYGSEKKYYNKALGYNSRLDEIQSMFLRIKLKNLDEKNKERSKLAEIYLKNLLDQKELALPQNSTGTSNVWHIFPVRSKRRDELIDHLTRNNIQTVIHYPIPPHLQKCYSSLGFGRGTFQISEDIHSQVLSLPLYPSLGEEKILDIVEALKSFKT